MISVLFKYSSSLSARQSIADLSVVHTKVIGHIECMWVFEEIE